MTPDRRGPWFNRLRMAAPAVFLGVGVYLVTRSVPVAVLVGAAVFILCRFLLGLNVPRPPDDD